MNSSLFHTLLLSVTVSLFSLTTLSSHHVEAKPTQPALKSAQPVKPSVAKSQKNTDGRVNINTASASALTRLKGIGKKRAEAIVEDRKANGPYSSPMDLTRVRGIGKKTVEKNLQMIVVGKPNGQSKSNKASEVRAAVKNAKLGAVRKDRPQQVLRKKTAPDPTR